MCNRYRVSAKQMEIAKQFGFPIDTLMPEPEPLPPPELFPKKIGWIVRKQDGERSLDAMKWGIPRRVTGKSGKPIVSTITNVRNLDSPFWRSTLANPHYRCLVPVTDFANGKARRVRSWSAGSTCRPRRSSPSPASGGRARKAIATPSLRANPTRWSRRSTQKRCR